MAHNIHSGFAIQNTFMSTAIIGRMVPQRYYPPSANYSANVPLDFCTTADFEMKYLFNEGTAGVLGNLPNWFSRFCSQNGYLNSKLMLRWDGHFKIEKCVNRS